MRNLLAGMLVVLVLGCGDDEPAAPAPQPTPAAAEAAADAGAKSAARDAVSELEVCFVDQQDYSRCRVKGPEVELVNASLAEYTLVARSESGTEFSVARAPDGTLSRSCTAPGTGGCPASGDW